MRKIYFITSIPKVAKDNIITGVVANGSGRQATAEEVSAITTLLREKGATTSLVDSLRCGSYPNPVAVFDRRAAARKEADLLNSYSGSFFNWHVLEVGESIRKPVRKPLGWRITFAGAFGATEVSCHVLHPSATVRIDGDEHNDTLYNMLFPTRDAARAVFNASSLGDEGMGYRIEPHYA
ncbi:hypothetical protein pXoo2106_07 [Xanthomonas phage pXoo2106]|uniref:Uncharacterized protein n=1 Tax=Xanthomonas phage pXoo2106 TaxID=2970483 RepID=A0AAX3C0V0_9CAUD|nr:hypothetical protein pXoo2106_07 [Xanthomonas phage pXoo2106]